MTGLAAPPFPVLLLFDKLIAIKNLHILIPIKLDIDEINYSSWEYFFQHLCKGQKLLNHILGKQSTDEIESSLGLPLGDEDIVNIALEGLHSKYDNVYRIIVHREFFPDLKTIRSMLTTKEMRLQSWAQDTFVDSTSSSPLVLLANTSTNT
ncbi:hypothetical protein Tco_0912418 [Tanacetum coccineum]